MKRCIRIFFFCFLLFVALPCTLQARGQKLRVFLFHSPSCGACLKVKNEFLPKIIEQYGSQIQLEMLDTQKKENLGMLISLSEQFQRKTTLVPSVFLGNEFFIGKKEIEANLEAAIKRNLKATSFLPISLSPKSLIEKFQSISVFTIISAGLIDGVNPCAFAVIVFFISFLGVYGYNKREMIYIGSCYVASVFLTYILIGMGLFKFLYAMRHFYFLMKTFYYLVAAFCFTLGIFAAYDYFKYRKTKDTSGMILQLPKFLKKRINIVIGTQMREKRYTRILELCFVSLGVGHAVSILEAACTGQVYLPTIAFILQVPHLRLKAFFYLAVYNLMFVLPLIIIFVLSLIGISSKQFNEFLKKNLGTVKILMVLLFFTLGAVMLFLS